MFKQPTGLVEFQRILSERSPPPSSGGMNLGLDGVAIWDAQLPDTDISGADIHHACFWNVGLDRVVATHSQLFWCIFSRCSMRNARWTDVTTKIPTLMRCDLERSSLRDVLLYHGRLIRCSFRRAIFDHVRFTGCILMANDWEGATFTGCEFD